MSELPVTPFPAAPGLQAFGDDDAGSCADGVCAVPAAGTDRVAGEPREGPGRAR